MDSADAGVPPLRIGALMIALVLGISYFFLHELAQAWFTRVRLPDAVMSFWYGQPRLGAWLIGAMQAVVTHWLVALSVGLALALAVRRELWLYGSMALGAWLTSAWLWRLDGWYALAQFGPQFWISMQTDALTLDPIGVLSAILALPVCAAWWGRRLARGKS